MEGSSKGRTQVRTRFKTAEGRYYLQSEKVSGLLSFNYLRSTRLTLATLTGGNEDGAWIVYNVGDHIHLSRRDATAKEPSRTLVFNGLPSRLGFPTCHAFMPAKDGIDLLVGLGDGQVLLLSLRTQLQSLMVLAKPTVASILTPEGASDVARCTAVAWIPRSEGTFAASFASGYVYVYKKPAVLGDGGSKFSLGMSGARSTSPASSFLVSSSGANDIAASPDGTRLAVACRDGALRLVDIASGAMVGGYQAYYGALLCCCFSSDGKYLAAGGEDDLVSIYGIAERMPVAYGEGHDSWVSRVVFDSWAPVNEVARAMSPTVSELAPPTRVYRLASVGQDARLCLWDLQLSLDADLLGGMYVPQPPTPTMNKSLSSQNFAPNSPGRAGAGPEGGPGVSHQHRPSLAGASGRPNGIMPALTRAEMCIIQPIMDHRVHVEPLSDLLCDKDFLFTADHGGCIKSWMRPSSSNQTDDSSTGDTPQ